MRECSIGLSGELNNQHREDDEDNRQHNAEVKQRSLYPPASTIDRIRLPENASQPSTMELR